MCDQSIHTNSGEMHFTQHTTKPNVISVTESEAKFWHCAQGIGGKGINVAMDSGNILPIVYICYIENCSENAHAQKYPGGGYQQIGSPSSSSSYVCIKLDKKHLQPSHIASDWNKCATESGAHVSEQSASHNVRLFGVCLHCHAMTSLLCDVCACTDIDRSGVQEFRTEKTEPPCEIMERIQNKQSHRLSMTNKWTYIRRDA